TLGFRRLSIIDLSEEANQPLYSTDGNIVLLFNGEIYNYEQLKAELIAKGYEFKTKSDTEVLLHSYLEYGIDFVKQLRGMFAICIWEKSKNQMILIRDGFGIKPLYYTNHTTDGTFI